MPAPFRHPVFNISQTHSKQKDGMPGRTGKMGFPPKGAPPTGINLFAVRQARKGGLRRGVEGGTSGGKTKRFARPLCCGRTAAPEVDEKKGAQKKKGKPRKWFPFFSALRKFTFIRSSVHIYLSQNYIDTQLFPNQSNLHQRQLILLNLLDFSRC